MALIRPRLTDYHRIPVTQEEVDFAIPFLDEDIPFCVDPFLMWKSPALQDQALHSLLLNTFNHLGLLLSMGKDDEAVDILNRASDCNEVGLGFSKSRRGKRIGEDAARTILALFKSIPQLQTSGFTHIEEIQLLVDGISYDRISDITCSFLKSFLIDYTYHQAEKYEIPMSRVGIRDVYDSHRQSFIDPEEVVLPVTPETGQPVLLVPKRWLRRAPWISYDNYYNSFYVTSLVKGKKVETPRAEVLTYNRRNYDMVSVYCKLKERQQRDCTNDPLFTPIPVLSAKRRISDILKLPTGRDSGSDKKYENLVSQLLASLLYPHLDFATNQSRTISGVHIRDLIFYNNKSKPLLVSLWDEYYARQIVFEIKNVDILDTEHIDQLNRYLGNEFGKFGVIITRHQVPGNVLRNIVDLWSGQRKKILVLTDEDLKLMVDIFQSKQRDPFDVLVKADVEFTRRCPV